ncbi:3'(2'),5'-bisphosphate nucleotidase CysQ [Pontibacter roseus]|uniref:3'(2'),5'-bisphosphate nucleotidase CysQ n=1 Tax=Pontibacter roseus TaxID=336989 RepID=UPI00035DB2E7|nr:3'(2'),5'-bisphosphate nucleotidase CysQ [Pontibacter roseus]
MAIPAPISLDDLLKTARTAALEAGASILEVYQSGDMGESLKADASPLTRADQAAHDIITRHLLVTGFPILSEEGSHLPYAERKNWEWYWLVDPLDGTKEFLKRNGEFTVNIALMHHAIPVAGVIYVPVQETLYWGSKETGAWKEMKGETTQLQPLPEKATLEKLLQTPGLTVVASRTHLTAETELFIQQFKDTQLSTMGSSLKFMLLAEGIADLYPRFAPTAEWDTAAAHAILRAVNRGIYQTNLKSELVYNKADLLNPSFIAF